VVSPPSATRIGADNRRRPGPLLWGAALFVVFLFIGHDPGRIRAAFGPSHDGFNAALYFTGGRALLEDGPLGSRLSASVRMISGDRVIYAHHPPLVYLEEAAAAAVVGPTEVAARVPAVLSSAVALILLVLLLSECGLSNGPGAMGLLFALATPMFMMFGATTEPHVLGLASMTALLLLWLRARSGLEVHRSALFIVAAIATLTSSQAALLAIVIGTAMLLVDRRLSTAAATLVGVGAAASLIAVWILWAYSGDPRDLLDRAVLRLGVGRLGHVTVRQAVRQQMMYCADLFPMGGWVIVPVAALGLLDSRTRGLAWPSHQRYAYHTFGDRGPTDLLPWLMFYSRREPYGVDGPQSVPVGEVVLRSVDGRLVPIDGQKVLSP
jgi:4-amino-4-deoxy-L-arabinose transferase-like glycosyltransferase